MSKSEITPYRIEEVRTVSNGVVCKAWKVIGLHAPQEVFRTKAKAKAWIESDTPPDRKHTPLPSLPWTQERELTPAGTVAEAKDRHGIEIHAANGIAIGMWVDYEWDGRNPQVDLIERACNSHYQLVEALQDLLTLAAPQLDISATHDGLRNVDTMAKALAALAEVKA